MPKPSAKQLKENRIAALRAKYAKGTQLSHSQLVEIGLAKPLQVNGSESDYVTTKGALAEALGIDRGTLNKVLNEEGNPGKDAHGWNVEKWRAWYEPRQKLRGRQGTRYAIDQDKPADPNGEGQQTISEARERAQLAKVQLEVDDARFESDLKRGKYILKGDVTRQTSECNAVVVREMRQRFTQIAPAECAQVEGEEAIRKILIRHVMETMAFLHSEEW